MTLKELRTQSGLTAAKVAEALGVEEQTLFRYEQGTRRIGLEQVLTLLALYECTAEEIIKAQLNSCQSYQANSRQ